MPLTLASDWFIAGGVKQSMWKELPKVLKSDFGFQGCIASLELNGVMVDPMKVGVTFKKSIHKLHKTNLKDALVPSQSVIEGCQGKIMDLVKHYYFNLILFLLLKLLF